MDRLSTKLKLAINRLNIAQARKEDTAIIDTLRQEVKNLYDNYSEAHDKIINEISGIEL